MFNEVEIPGTSPTEYELRTYMDARAAWQRGERDARVLSGLCHLKLRSLSPIVTKLRQKYGWFTPAKPTIIWSLERRMAKVEEETEEYAIARKMWDEYVPLAEIAEACSVSKQDMHRTILRLRKKHDWFPLRDARSKMYDTVTPLSRLMDNMGHEENDRWNLRARNATEFELREYAEARRMWGKRIEVGVIASVYGMPKNKMVGIMEVLRNKYLWFRPDWKTYRIPEFEKDDKRYGTPFPDYGTVEMYLATLPPPPAPRPPPPPPLYPPPPPIPLDELFPEWEPPAVPPPTPAHQNDHPNRPQNPKGKLENLTEEERKRYLGNMFKFNQWYVSIYGDHPWPK
jgi:predicted DNA-binding protein YlxM (UPF0122 family)